VEKLFIIGNGFDIAHDLKTDYLYFKKFVYQQAYGKDELLESLQSENAMKLYLNRIDEEILLEEIDDYSIPEMQRGPEGEKLYPDDVDLYKLLYLLMGQITETEKFWSDFEAKLADFAPEIDVALLGPQVAYTLDKSKAICEANHIPIAVIPMADYGMLDGKKVLNLALELLGEK